MLQLEERFWLEGAAFYARTLSSEAWMVLPAPVGVLTREQVLASVDHNPRWAEVAFSGERIAGLGPEVLVLTYEALAKRSGTPEPYRCYASSVYVRSQDGWRLALHQQTPASSP